MEVADPSDGAVDLDPDRDGVVALFNPTDEPIAFAVGALAGSDMYLHPLLVRSVDSVVRSASFEDATGTFSIPARTAAVFVDYALTVCGAEGPDEGCVVPAGTAYDGNVDVDGEVLVLGEVTGHVKARGGTVTIGTGGTVGKHIDQKGDGDVVLEAGSMLGGKVKESGAGSVVVAGWVGQDVEEKDAGDLTIAIGAVVGRDVKESGDGNVALFGPSTVGRDVKESDDGDLVAGAAVLVNRDADSSGSGTCTISPDATVGGKLKGDCKP